MDDINGDPVEVGSLFHKDTMVVVLLRQFGCLFCRLAAKRMMDLYPLLRERGLGLIAIGTGTPEQAREFAAEFSFPREALFVDQARKVYTTLQLRRGLKYVVTKETLNMALVANNEGLQQVERGPLTFRERPQVTCCN